MVSSEPAERAIVVSGDVTMDWNLARVTTPQEERWMWGAGSSIRACWQRGGAALLADVVEAVAASLQGSGGAGWSVRQMAAPRQPVDPADSRFIHSYAMWSLFPFSTRSSSEPKAWRVEEYLGYDPPRQQATQPEDWKRVVDDMAQADVVVVDDAGIGFRDRPELWPAAIVEAGRHPWVVLKMATPVAKGALWQHLVQEHAERLVVVMTVHSLRHSEVQVSRELSWERTAQDLFWELVHNPRVNSLSRAAYVVVSFGPAGAILLSRGRATGGRGEAGRTCSLFFDPAVVEGAWEQGYPGGMIGYNTCLTAAITRQVMLAPGGPAIDQGVKSGLAAVRWLHGEGYGVRGTPATQSPVVLPVGRLAGQLAVDKTPFAVVDVQDPVRFLDNSRADGERAPEGGFWTILQDRYSGDLERVAEQIVLAGAEASLKGVPLGIFGNLLTVDRREIEGFRSIRALVGEYCRQVAPKRPLSVAVFGSPGSGKSFGITQVAHSLLPGQIEVLEFNLSQMGSPVDLLGALHRVRDAGLSGKIPLVFWDEFDTTLGGQPLGWLRYFLAPMQDGRFQEGQISHPIGRAIFVFAGGTCACMADFGQALPPEGFRAAKGPDFVSRLKGYVNVLGPNRRRPEGGCGAEADHHYSIRRAILLRSILRLNVPQLFAKREGQEFLNVDRGVLRAFLQTREYRHGVRSMEAIVAMSQLAGKKRYERSSLPAEAQLDLHVDGQDFLALVQSLDLEGEVLERLARALHTVFCESMVAQGYRLGARTDDEAKTHSSLLPFEELPEEEQEQNRLAVLDFVHKLERAGYVMLPARSDELPFDFPGPDLELLAEMEHVRWTEARQAAGWQYGPETDKERKLHRSMVPWAKLPEVDKEKDRELVRRIPDVLARVGYAILPVR